MAQWLKQSTAIYVQLGPFLDEDDGKTAETGLTISQADVRLSKGGAAFAQKNDANAAVHDAAGWYRCQLDATDTGTLGRLIVAIHESGALPVWREFLIVPSNVWDSYFSTDRLQVDVREMAAGVITAPVVATGAIDADAIAADAITSSELAASAAQEIADAVWDEAKAGHVGAGSFGEEVQAHALSSEIAALNDPTAGAVADAVWDEAKAGHVGAGSFGEEVQAHALSSEVAGLNDLSAAQVNAEVDTALTDIHLDHLLAADYDPASKPGVATALLNELVEDDGGVSRYTANALEQAPTGGSAPTVAEIADGVWDEAKSGHVGAGSFGEEVQGHATPAEVDAECDEALTNYDAATKAELDSGLAGLNDPTAAAIADAVWDEAKSGHVGAGSFGEEVQGHATPAEVDAECDEALTNYDAPTKAELDSGLAGLNDPTATAIADAVWDEAKAGHVGAGSFGEEVQAHALSSEIAALNDPTAGAVADAVWDEAKADHVAAGSLGEEVQAHALSSEIAALNDPTATAIADETLKRGISNVEDVADATSLAALVLAAFESAVVGTTWTIRKSGGTTFATRTVTQDPDADPIVGVT